MKSEARHKCDYVILNSVSQAGKVIPILRPYKHVRCYFDNDEAGRNAFGIVRKDVNAISCSEKMLPHNDVNDYLCGLRVRSLSDADADWEGKKCHSLRMTEEPSPDGRNEQLGKHH